MSENRVLPHFNSTIQCIYFQGYDISVATISRLLEQMEGGAHGGGGYGHYHYHYHHLNILIIITLLYHY